MNTLHRIYINKQLIKFGISDPISEPISKFINFLEKEKKTTCIGECPIHADIFCDNLHDKLYYHLISDINMFVKKIIENQNNRIMNPIIQPKNQPNDEFTLWIFGIKYYFSSEEMMQNIIQSIKHQLLK